MLYINMHKTTWCPFPEGRVPNTEKLTSFYNDCYVVPFGTVATELIKYFYAASKTGSSTFPLLPFCPYVLLKDWKPTHSFSGKRLCKSNINQLKILVFCACAETHSCYTVQNKVFSAFLLLSAPQS